MDELREQKTVTQSGEQETAQPEEQVTPAEEQVTPAEQEAAPAEQEAAPAEDKPGKGPDRALARRFKLLRLGLSAVLALALFFSSALPLYGHIYDIPAVDMVLKEFSVRPILEEAADIAEEAARDLLGDAESSLVKAATDLTHSRSFMDLRRFVKELEGDSGWVGFLYGLFGPEDISTIMDLAYTVVTLVFAFCALLVLLSGLFKRYWLCVFSALVGSVVLGVTVGVWAVLLLVAGQVGHIWLLRKQRKALAK